VNESLLKAIANSSILLGGILIMSNAKYKKSLLVVCFVTMVLISSFTFHFGFQIGIISLFVVILIFSRFTKDKWRYTFFLLINTISLVIVTKYWSNFIAFNLIEIFGLSHTNWYMLISVFIQSLIAVGIFRLMLKIFEGIGVHLFLETLEYGYSKILIFGLFTIQIFYIVLTYVPNVITDYDFLSILVIQTIYTTLLAVVTTSMMILFRYLVKHKIELEERNATLEQLSLQLLKVGGELVENTAVLAQTQQRIATDQLLIAQVTQDLKEKERLLRFMDKQIATLSETRQKLMDFEHDQLNFIIALDGGIRSGDTEVMRKSLEQYGAAVQEVLELKSDSLDLTNLYDSRMLPIRYLILAKTQLAISQDVKVTLEVPTEITRVGMDLKDFVRILGIWLDNAIEEAIQLDDKWIHISFILSRDEDEKIDILEVRVSNSCRPKQQSDITKLHDQGFTSKEGKSRGNGLRIVRGLMFKHDNIHLETRVKTDDDRFTQLLSIALPQ